MFIGGQCFQTNDSGSISEYQIGLEYLFTALVTKFGLCEYRIKNIVLIVQDLVQVINKAFGRLFEKKLEFNNQLLQ